MDRLLPRTGFEHSQREKLRQMDQRQLKIWYYLAGLSFIAAAPMNNEAANWYIDAHTVILENREANKRREPPEPPKPPRRRRIPLRVALGNT